MRPIDNPFRAQRIDALAYRMPERAWRSLCERLEAGGVRGGFVGPHGHGKSTALRRLECHLRSDEREVRSLRADREPRLGKVLREAGPPTVFLLDGVERLGPLGRRAVRRRARRHGGVVVTVHDERSLARLGLPLLWRCQTGLGLLEELVDELLAEWAEDDVERVRRLLPEIFVRHRGNLRRCLFELYDLWPRLCAAEERTSVQAVHGA